ncbi:MAG: AraC family transcriptional regulator [Rhizobiaceae bacterium]
MTDLISNILDMIRVKGTAYYSKHVVAPWGMEVDQHDHLYRFHLVLSGSAWVGLADDRDRQFLGEGDFVIVPDGRGHLLSDSREVSGHSLHHIPGETFRPEFQQSGPATDQTQLLCGYFQFAHGLPSMLTSRLPSLFITRINSAGRSEQISQVAKLLKSELNRAEQPQTMILNRLTEILFYHAVREWFDAALLPSGSLHALADLRLQKVFEEIHQNPSQAWTVESLAKIAGQSRTVFAAHFKHATGESPITYLAQWRAELARKLLSETDKAIDQIAVEIGYQDSNAFNRAFKRVTGSPPGAFRRSQKGNTHTSQTLE